MKRTPSKLLPVDILFITFAMYMSFVGVLTVRSPHSLFMFLLLNVFFVSAVLILSRLSDSSKIFRIMHDWYPMPGLYLIYKDVYVVIQSMGVKDWDGFFIEADRLLFGVDPTVWLSQYINPFLTEILQFAYASYFLIMLSLAFELYLKKEYEKFYFSVFAMLFGFILSYFGYMLFPAVGPRFTLHDFDMMNKELPGVWLAIWIRDFLNTGESIPRNAVNAIAVAQRDVFPSGHTQMTIVTIILAFRYKVKCRHIIALIGILLIISTVYLRYHYVVDIIGGIIFVWPTLWLAPKLFRRWQTKNIP